MSAAAPRTAQATPDMRQLGVALLALALAVALLVAVTISQAGTQVSTAPAAGTAPVVHDHGWIDASYKTRPAIRRNGFDKAHAPGLNRDLVVSGAGGGILYTGIPYPAPASNGGGSNGGGSNGTRLAL
jgi:hypothetical protein